VKTIIFSDTHLGRKFELDKFNFLIGVIRKADRVIINGDFWEGYVINFAEFAKTEWRRLFPELKKRHTVYLPGNHERRSGVGREVKEFCDELTDEFRLRSGRWKLVVSHGDKFDRLPELHLPIPIFHVVQETEEWGIRAYGKSFLRLVYGVAAKAVKRTVMMQKQKDVTMVIGHTHIAEADLTAGFINSGVIKGGLGQYLIMDGNRLELVETSY